MKFRGISWDFVGPIGPEIFVGLCQEAYFWGRFFRGGCPQPHFLGVFFSGGVREISWDFVGFRGILKMLLSRPPTPLLAFHGAYQRKMRESGSLEAQLDGF